MKELKERKFKDVTDMAETADTYLEAHGSQIGKAANSVRPESRKVVYNTRGAGGTCYVCQGPHLMRECPKKRHLFQPKRLTMTMHRIEVGQLHGTTKMDVELQAEVTTNHTVCMSMKKRLEATIGRTCQRVACR